VADFEKSIGKILEHEGGYVDHPSDPGGATNFGISARFLRGIRDERHPKDISKEDAVELYRIHFWDRYGYGEIEDQDIATKVFDCTVNMGPSSGHKILQRALRAVGHSQVDDDGVLGNITITAANNSPNGVAIVMKSEQAARYREIVARDPEKKVFMKGWLRRAYEDDA
jgi:lysozyme family protein